jgi:site-specific recombinase XerD
MKTRYSLIYDRKKLGLPESIIQIRAYYNGKYRFFNSGVKVKRKEWDEKAQRINHHHSNYIQLNKFLQGQISKFQDFELSVLNAGKRFRLEMFDSLRDDGPRQSFNQFIEQELENSSLKKSTIRQQKSFLRKLNRYNNNIDFEGLDYDFFCRYEKYLRDKKLSQNSIHKEFKNIKKFLNVAINKELFDEGKNPFKKFKIKTVPSNISFITEEETERIERLEFQQGEKEVEFIRDLYLLGIYTGLRFSDLMNLKKESIQEQNKDGSAKIVLKMQKTSDYVYLPINTLYRGKPLQLIKKHMQEEGELVFKHYTNQHVNRMLKVIGKMAGVSKPITFHTSRHTFGTTLLNKGMPIEMVQRLMGHQRIQQTLEYAKLQTNTIEKQLNEIFKAG